MFNVSKTITELRGEFEGGASLSLDFYSYLTRGARNVLDNVNPETLKRRTPIFGGVTNNLAIYYCPNDVQVPSAIYRQPNDRRPIATYTDPHNFYCTNETNLFTIETINGVRFLIFRQSVPYGFLSLDEMDEVGTIISDQTLTVNDFNYVSGNAALQRTFTARSGTAFTAENTTNVITSAGHGLSNGDRVYVYTSGGTLPIGLVERTIYHVIDATTDTFKLALENGGTEVAFTSDGSNLFWHAYNQNAIERTLGSTIDITDMLNGVSLIPMYFNNPSNIARVELFLEEDVDNYYKLTSLQDSVGDNFIEGINMVRFKFANAEVVGDPDNTGIAQWRLVIETIDGTTETVIIDRISLQQTQHYYFEYYSDRLFIDGTTGAWKTEPAKGDLVNLDDKLRDVLHYETAILIAQGNTEIRTSGSSFDNFSTQLVRKYQAYWGRFPSTEQPVSYNHLRDDQEVSESIGTYEGAEITVLNDRYVETTQFVDNETPVGVFDDVNTDFTLAFVPNPKDSLLLWLNGVYQTQGADYTLTGNVISFNTPPSSAFAGLPFIAVYRYQA